MPFHGNSRPFAPKRIGLVSNSADLGVMVVRNLLIKLIREKYRDARIVILAEANIIDKVRRFHEHNSWIDECMSIESERVEKPLERMKLWRRLRARRFDMMILDPGTKLPFSLLYWCGIPIRVGLCHDEKQRRYLSHPVDLELAAEDQYMYLHWSRIIAAYARALQLDAFQGVSAYVPFIRVQSCGTVDRAGAGRRIVVHAGGNPEWNRRWPLSRFAKLCCMLCNQDQLSIFLLGGKDEGPDNRWIVEAVKSQDGAAQIFDTSHSTIQEMTAHIAAADLFIGNDSGPMNIAVALGIPVVAIRGADAENFRPDIIDTIHTVISNWDNCARKKNGSNDCTYGCPVAYDRDKQDYPKCMEEISVDRVWQVVVKKLEREILRCNENQ